MTNTAADESYLPSADFAADQEPAGTPSPTTEDDWDDEADTDPSDTLPVPLLASNLATPSGSPDSSISNDGLFHIDGATPGTVQWKAERFQLVNWGGFHGRVELTFEPGATLITGPSGTGKSTLLDAYIALMMPADTAFNGASNDAVTGRARSSEQRNLVSYLRGKTDTIADERGRAVDKVLRGQGVATWGALAMTFVNDHAQRFTVLRTYYLPARATRWTGEGTMRMATFDGYLDLADLEPLADQLFAPKALKAAFPGIRTYDTYASFSSVLFTRLGIGANGDGEKALRLLVRIQSGQQIRTVDELFKQMVLERPSTYAHADQAIGHFDDLDASFTAMQTEQHKADLLAPITGRHETMTDALSEISTLDTFGLDRAGDTVVSVWANRTEAALLEDAVEANRVQRAANAQAQRVTKDRRLTLEKQLLDAQESYRASGGGELEQLANAIEQAEARREGRRSTHARLVERTSVLESAFATRAEYEAIHEHAVAFLASHDQVLADLRARRDAVMHERQFPLLQRKGELGAERESLASRAGRVTRPMDEMRQQVARAAGIDVSDLPFIAELIDIHPEHAAWRTAIETVLGASARLLLVPADRLEHFSRAIDSERLRGRLTFEGVSPSADRDRPATTPDRIAGKLEYADSPYIAWVRHHLAEPARNAVCVREASELAGLELRVTPAGQTRQGSRGSHGRGGRENIIGFSSEDAIADIDQELYALERDLKAVDDTLSELDGQFSDAGRRLRAYQAVEDVAWVDIDVCGVEAEIADLTRQRETLLSASDPLRALAEHIDNLTGELDGVRARAHDLWRDGEAMDDAHGELCERQDQVNDELDRVEREGRVLLDDAQSARLTAELAAAAAPGDPANLADFPANLSRLRSRLTAGLEAAQTRYQAAERDLAHIFGQYQDRWDDPNLGRTAGSYNDYAAILDNILTTGLHERRSEWRRKLTQWSGEDLVPLAGAMVEGIEDIEDRLHPINDILASLPFGARRDRLSIKLRKLHPDNVVRFRQQLNKLSGAATRELAEDQLERRFAELRAFMALIRHRSDPRFTVGVGDRDGLLDVRRHVEITAQRCSVDGTHLGSHSGLGDKSGGESQELVAFIVGAALRFRLGDELRARPRFAPVFLDEGFVKADAEFAGRAVQAWKGLGFQLIIGAPQDKVVGLEPHMNSLLGITKNLTNDYSFVHRIRDAGDVAAPDADASRRERTDPTGSAPTTWPGQ